MLKFSVLLVFASTSLIEKSSCLVLTRARTNTEIRICFGVQDNTTTPLSDQMKLKYINSVQIFTFFPSSVSGKGKQIKASTIQRTRKTRVDLCYHNIYIPFGKYVTSNYNNQLFIMSFDDSLSSPSPSPQLSFGLI